MCVCVCVCNAPNNRLTQGFRLFLYNGHSIDYMDRTLSVIGTCQVNFYISSGACVWCVVCGGGGGVVSIKKRSPQ